MIWRVHTNFQVSQICPLNFKKQCTYHLIGLKTMYCFLDDIENVSQGAEDEHRKYVFDSLHRTDEEFLWVNLTKCFLAKLEIYWLDHHVSQTGISSFESKTSSVLSMKHQKLHRKSFLFLVLFITAVNSFKFCTNQSSITPFIMQISFKFVWEDFHKKWEDFHKR